jgi:hypothetical protein
VVDGAYGFAATVGGCDGHVLLGNGSRRQSHSLTPKTGQPEVRRISEGTRSRLPPLID